MGGELVQKEQTDTYSSLTISFLQLVLAKKL